MDPQKKQKAGSTSYQPSPENCAVAAAQNS
jgi:hypothetical protein